METLKAGCFLVNKETQEIALVYRQKQNDYSFPKGHLEKGETLEECAVRETAEETKRVAKIVKKYQPYVERYTTPKGEKCACYMYIALDEGASDNTSEDTHPTMWIPFDDVEQKLTYQNLKDTWNNVKDKISELFGVGDNTNKICQSCAMPIENDDQFATNADGSINKDYCKYCMKNGKFIDDVTMEEYIDMCSKYGSQAGMTNEQMKAHCQKVFPTLKRWKDK